jgi:hypothetical protein
MTPLEPEVEKEGEPYCYEHEPIAKAEEVMRQMKADAVSVVSEEKKLIGKATRDAIEEERLKRSTKKVTHNIKTTIAIPIFQVSDVEASLKHYVGIFGFSEDFRFGDDAGIKLGDVRLHLSGDSVHERPVGRGGLYSVQ